MFGPLTENMQRYFLLLIASFVCSTTPWGSSPAQSRPPQVQPDSSLPPPPATPSPDNRTGNFGTIDNRGGTVTFTDVYVLQFGGDPTKQPPATGLSPTDEALRGSVLQQLARMKQAQIVPQQPTGDGPQSSQGANEELGEAAKGASEGDFVNARHLFDKLRAKAIGSGVPTDKTAAEACFGLALIDEAQGALDSANGYLVEAAKFDPDELAYPAFRARLQALRGQRDTATQLLASVESRLSIPGAAASTDILRWIGDTYLDLERPEDAVGSYEKALSHIQPDHTPVLRTTKLYTVQNLASAQLQLFRFGDASKNYAEAKRLYDAAQIPNRERFILYNNLAKLYLDSGCLALARDWANIVIMQDGHELSSHDFVLAFSYHTYGAALFYDGRADAEGFLQTASDNAISAFGPDHWRVLQIRTTLAELLLASSRPVPLSIVRRSPGDLPKRPFRQYVITAATLSRVALASGNRLLAQQWLNEAQSYLARVKDSIIGPVQAKVSLAQASFALVDGNNLEVLRLLKQALLADPTQASASLIITWKSFDSVSTHGGAVGLQPSNWPLPTPRLDCARELYPP